MLKNYLAEIIFYASDGKRRLAKTTIGKNCICAGELQQ